MHFIAEACYKRPLEPRGLVYSRGGTAITMGLLFLSFCGYLISQIYDDRPLIQISSEEIKTDIDTPDIELCVEKSSVTIVRCSAMYYNWTQVEVPNCWERFFRPGNNADNSPKCYVFETNGTYRMAVGVQFGNRDAFRRLDFYWHIDELKNLTEAGLSIPAIAVQLYDPHFSTWKIATVGDTTIERQTSNNIQLGSTRATSFLNHTTIIYYYSQKYRAIKPVDASSILGLKPEYIDIMTLPNFQQDWPIRSDPPPANRSLYHGQFSVQLAQSTIDVKTEVRQHTVLAAVALAGGCYGILTTIYIMLFGMTRLTPWGLVHHIPVFISKRKDHAKDDMSMVKPTFDQTISDSDKVLPKKKGLSSAAIVPWFFRSRIRGNKTPTDNGTNDIFMQHMVVKKELEQAEKEMHHPNAQDHQQRNSLSGKNSGDSLIEQCLSTPITQASSSPPLYTMPTAGGPSSRPDDDNPSLNNIVNLLRSEQKKSSMLEERSAELSNRVEELEVILSEYFINTNYLDQLRARKDSKLIPRTSRRSWRNQDADKMLL